MHDKKAHMDKCLIKVQLEAAYLSLRQWMDRFMYCKCRFYTTAKFQVSLTLTTHVLFSDNIRGYWTRVNSEKTWLCTSLSIVHMKSTNWSTITALQTHIWLRFQKQWQRARINITPSRCVVRLMGLHRLIVIPINVMLCDYHSCTCQNTCWTDIDQDVPQWHGFE